MPQVHTPPATVPSSTAPSRCKIGLTASENDALRQLTPISEIGYGMHVAQQLRVLPMRSRETVRNKINQLLYDELIQGETGDIARRSI